MTTSSQTTTTAPTDFTTANPCPDYCNLEPGHPADSLHPDTGRESRGHGGPAADFGPHLSGGSVEFTDEPGVFHHSVWLDEAQEFESVAELAVFAGNMADAVAWLERVQA